VLSERPASGRVSGTGRPRGLASECASGRADRRAGRPAGVRVRPSPERMGEEAGRRRVRVSVRAGRPASERAGRVSGLTRTVTLTPGEGAGRRQVGERASERDGTLGLSLAGLVPSGARGLSHSLLGRAKQV
jgi:hypothetical protein